MPLESRMSAAVIRKAKLRWGRRICIRKRHVSMGIAGDPDLTGCLQGIHFEIEMKQPTNAPTALQKARIEEWKLAGAAATVAYSTDEALEFLESIAEDAA